MRNILNDWESKPELTAAITALNLGTWKADLAAANTLFAAKYLDRAQETGAASPENIKNKRTEANEAWYALRDLINAHFIIEKGAAPYGPTVTFINGLIEYYNNLIARRGQGEEVVETPAAPAVAL